jgi:hypothetical protein
MNPDVTIARLVREQHGVVTRSQALANGLTPEQSDHQLERGVLVAVHPGVYRHAAVPATRSGRLMAAVLAAGAGAVASHRSAAWLHGFRGVPSFRPELTVPRSALPVHDGVLVHRTNLLDDADQAVVDGIRCTSRARTLLDLGAVLPYELVEPVVQDAVITKRVGHAELLAILERVGKRGRRGTAVLRAAVRDAVPDERLESELERRLLALLPEAPGLVLQHELVHPDGRRFRLDAALPASRVAIEANGHRWHGTAQALRRDMERRRALHSMGWTLYEFGWADVVDHPGETAAELRDIVLRSLSDLP